MNPKEILVDVNEIKRYEEAVSAVTTGKMDADRFMAFRLQHGIYGQRQENTHMVRIKVPGGRLIPQQLRVIANTMDKYSDDKAACVTTRQDIQFHFIPLKDTPKLMHELGEAGLTTREACGNTVRNITGCSLAGICPREHTDVTTFIDDTTAHFLRHPLTQHLPRKFKMSFSGCEADCAMGLMHDVGVVATRRNEQFGFKILAGGGLGHKPREAIVVEEFISEEQLLPSIEALVALHNRYSDRKRRAKARIKFLVDKFGADGFRVKYKEEYARTRTAFQSADAPRGDWVSNTQGPICGAGAPRQILAQKQPDRHILPLSLPTGDITSHQLRAIANIMEAEGLDDVRTTVDQNLMIVNIPAERIDHLQHALQEHDLSAPKTGDNVVSCPGTTTCRLGITSSKLVAPQLSGGNTDLRIRVSGCHNSCGQHHVADIGIHGEGKRRHGRLIPSYVMHLGGDGIDGGHIAMKGPVIPTQRIETAISRVQEAYEQDRSNGQSFMAWSRNKSVDYFKNLLADLATVNEEDVAFLARDHGEQDSFRVLQLGGGECAGAAQDLVASNFSEAMHERNYRDAFILQRKYAESLECAEQILRLAAQSILFLYGQKPSDSLSELGALLQTHTSDTQLASTFDELVEQANALAENFEQTAYDSFKQNMDVWTHHAGTACQQLDKQLDLATSLPSLNELSSIEEEHAQVIDLSAYDCPLHYIKARNELRNVQEGKSVNFVLDGDDALRQVSNSLKSDGHEILDVQPREDGVLLTVRKTHSLSKTG